MSEADYRDVISHRADILLRTTGIDYSQFAWGPVAFDYEAMMRSGGYSVDEIARIQTSNGVGSTPLLELPNVTALVRANAAAGKGARIFLKDEAYNPSGSFKDRRASISAHHARAHGYAGLVAATSGNYGAAVASQSARHGLKSIIVQETFDSHGRGQPEILEKGRKCEALGAEVLQATVGPELFYMLLKTLDETHFFNASLYTPFSVLGIETLGLEIARQTRDLAGRDPDTVLVTHAGGGNVTGVARGLHAAGASSSMVVAVSVDLSGLHMASDEDFNRKSFTTGHTGFSMPFSSWPDRVDVPRNAARALRYVDRFVTVTQGEVFFATELLARAEGLERGPAGNTSLAAAVAVARDMEEDQIVIISETEYTGAGKNPVAQLQFAEEMGVEVVLGDPRHNVPGRRIVIPRALSDVAVVDIPLAKLRLSYLKRALELAGGRFDDREERFVAADTHMDVAGVRNVLRELL
jgi:cysteine synthase